MYLNGPVMLTLWAFILLAPRELMGKHVAVRRQLMAPHNPLTLDMAPNSVDDFYEGCRNNMWAAVMTNYLEDEKKRDKKFSEVWTKADTHAKKPGPGLKKVHSMAIYIYTLGAPHDFYRDLNGAVRNQMSQYGTTFKYHAVHFLLTDAIRILHSNQQKKCLTTYRRSPLKFNQNVLNKQIRFGVFTSSSLVGYATKTFGTMSCFKTITCLGAIIADYSFFPDEREVLIPPYEVFKVTAIQDKKKKKDLECEVEYTLKATGLQSQLNCALFK